MIEMIAIGAKVEFLDENGRRRFGVVQMPMKGQQVQVMSPIGERVKGKLYWVEPHRIVRVVS